MDAVLTPNRSLSPNGFVIVMLIVGLGSFCAGLMFVSMGAWPIVGFFGLDAFAIWYAFRRSFKSQRETTRIRISSRSVGLYHTDAKGAVKTAELPSAFTRVELQEPVKPTDWLRIEYGRSAYIIGRFLTPIERKSLATALRSALKQAQSYRGG